MAAQSTTSSNQTSIFPSNKMEGREVIDFLNELWSNMKLSISYVDDDECEHQMTYYSRYNDAVVYLPPTIPNNNDGLHHDLISYFQQLLNLNNHKSKVIYYLHEEGYFHVVSDDEFKALVQSPDNRADYTNKDINDPIPVYNPDIAYTWMWVERGVATKYFTCGDVDDLDQKSRCYRSSYGIYEQAIEVA